MTKVFIAGSEGTAGLRLASRLKERPDVELLEIDSVLRKDPYEIKRLLENPRAPRTIYYDHKSLLDMLSHKSAYYEHRKVITEYFR